MGILDGKVALITGAGRGIGREDALQMAQEGAKIVINDVGTSRNEDTADQTPAQQVADEIKKMGGEAVANYDSVTDFNGAKRMVDQAIETFGKLDIVVNNAGILRDRMVFKMDEAEWDSVVAVHLKGTFTCTRHAAAYWRDESKAGKDVKAAIVNMVSDAGLVGNPGQSNYGAAKAGIAAFTIITGAELERYGVRVNAVCPLARTRLTTEAATTSFMSEKPPEGQFDTFDPANIAPLVTYLSSDSAEGVNGKVFHIAGGDIGLMEGWTTQKSISQEARWDPSKLAEKIKDIL